MKRISIAGSKVTLEEVKAAIVEKEYVKMGKKKVVCHLTLADGFEVIGTAGIVDPAGFDMKIGSDIALNDALNQVWSHMGSILQDRLAPVAETYIDRVVIEREELADKVEKLRNALDLKKVPASAIEILTDQLKVMIRYKDILDERLGLN